MLILIPKMEIIVKNPLKLHRMNHDRATAAETIHPRSPLHPTISASQCITLGGNDPWRRLSAARGNIRLVLILKGTAQVEEAGVYHLITSYSAFLGRPDESLMIKAAHRKTTEVAELIFSDQLASEYLKALQLRYGKILKLPEDRTARRYTRSLLTPEKVPSSRDIFYWISGLHEAARIRELNLGQLITDGLSTLNVMAERNGFSLKAIAKELGCSPNYLCKCWKNRGHQPLGPLLRTLRFRLARRLLRSPDMSVKAIANQCGFSGASAFCTAFKSSAKCTPGQWRNSPPPKMPEDAEFNPIVVKPFTDELRLGELSGHDERPICLWNGPFFQFDGGEVNFPYDSPYRLAFNTITSAVFWVCTLEGNACFEVGDTSLEVGPGTVILHPKPLFAQWKTPGGAPWKRIWIQMRDEWSIRAINQLCSHYGWAFKIPLSSNAVSISRKWVERWNAGRGVPSVKRSRSAYEWLLSWEDLILSGEATKIDLPDLKQFQFNSFYRKIGTISGYAKEIGYSRSYLTRRLRKQWHGGTPSQIVRRHRLAQAAHELRNQRDPVGEIARRALYSNPSAFIAAFKKEYGITPLAYRYRNP